MWMMTKIGFFSIVEKPIGRGVGSGWIQIRARCKQDLENLQEELALCDCKIITTVRADYHYRIVLQRDVFEVHFPEFLKLVTYSNFKDEVSKTNKRRELLYHQVWWLLRQIEAEDKHNFEMESDDDD